MNYLLANCFNFDQIANLKNHDGIKKKTPLMSSIAANRNGTGASGIVANGLGTAISGFSTDRRPVKMKDYGVLRGGALNQNSQSAT